MPFGWLQVGRVLADLKMTEGAVPVRAAEEAEAEVARAAAAPPAVTEQLGIVGIKVKIMWAWGRVEV